LNEVAKKARNYLRLSSNCAQPSFSALNDQFGLGADITLIKALTPLPGIALRGETCGIVTSSMLALGIVYGRDRLDDSEGFFRSLPPCRAFCGAFSKEFGGTKCDDVTRSLCGRTYNLANPAEAEEWRNSGVADRCSDVIAKGVRMAAEIIMQRTL
jgi:hypothetical protein